MSAAALFDCTRMETGMAKGSKTFQVGRNSETGRLVKVSVAKAKPKTHTVERMPKSGHGDTK